MKKNNLLISFGIALSLISTVSVAEMNMGSPNITSDMNKKMKSEHIKKFADDVEDLYFKESGVLKPSARDIYFEDVMADSVSKKESKHEDVEKVRKEIIQESAMTYGAQSGAAHRGYRINLELSKFSGYLDNIFNFRYLMLEEGVLPPVLSEGMNTYQQTGTNQVRTASHVYKIEFPARFVSTPPTWRSYLTQNFSKPEKPHGSLLPQSEAEGELWNKWVSEGWKMGLDQAQSSFKSSVARLKRDYLGMLRYRKLYAKGMVSKPIVARSHLGVTGGGNEMSVDDKVFKITEDSSLNPNKKDWSNPPEPFNPYDN